MLSSSTPDGIAPLSSTGVLIFSLIISFMFIFWGIYSLFMLLRLSQEGQSAQKSQRIRQLTRKLFVATLNIYKLDIIVSLVALLIFYLIIMGALNSFQSFYQCLAYLFGGINSLLCGLASLFTAGLAIPRILSSARYSKYDSFHASRLSANFQTFFIFGWNTLWVSLGLILYEFEHEDLLNKKQIIQKLTNSFVCFAFGAATVSIGTRICHSIYQKGAQLSVQTLSIYQDRLSRDYKHPALLAKAVGQIVNKEISSIIDTITFVMVTLAYSTHSAAIYVIGSDQQGQILFDHDYQNIYLPTMALIFSMIFTLLSNIGFQFIARPSNGQQLRTAFNLQRYTTIFFLIGFLSLVSYLCLPAQFQITQIGQFVRYPYHAYLCMLFGLILSFLLGLSSQLFTTHPFFVNKISKSCNTGSATNLIYGISFGYLYNFIPTLLLVSFGFLSNYWIGTFGVSLQAVGFILLLPIYLNYRIIYSQLDNCSYISYISNLDQGTVGTLIDLSSSRKDFDPHIQTIFYGLLCYIGYVQYLLFSSFASMGDIISLNDPAIFLGILIGAMFPYFFSAFIIRSINKTFLAIAYDIRNQIQQIPSMSNGGIDADFIRTNSLFSFQCILSIKRFIPSLFFPFIILGIGTGPKPVIGFLIGMVISGIQLGFSTGISGCLWSTVKKQINLGNIRDSQMNTIRSDSEWGKAAEVGNQVGLPLKDAINQAIHLIIIYNGILCCVLGPVFQRIHS